MDNGWTRRGFLKTAGSGAIMAGSTMTAADPARARSVGQESKNRKTAWFATEENSWKANLSRPEHEIKFEFDAKIPLRDGVQLSANIWRPSRPGNFPVVIMYTPYDLTSNWAMGEAQYFTSCEYAFAGIVLRGR